MKKNIRLLLFMVLVFSYLPFYGISSVEIKPISVIKAKKIPDSVINFHTEGITISFSRKQVLNVLKSGLKSENDNTGSDSYKMRLILHDKIKSLDCLDIIYDDNEVVPNFMLFGSILDYNSARLLHEICTDLLDSGYYKVSDDGKNEKEVRKAEVYMRNEYSSTTYFKYYLKSNRYLWTGYLIIQDDF